MADRFVVDTSVFLRWYVPQIGFEHAREVRQDFLTGAVALETVDSTRFELGHVLRTKGLLGGHLTAAQYRAAVRSIDDLGITWLPALGAIEERARLIGDGFGVEVALVWPLVGSHNHLADTGPSAADRAVTRRLVAAGHLLGIPLLASLVVEPSATHDLVSDRTWRT